MNTNPTAQLEMVSSSQKTSTQSSKYLKYEPDGIPQVIRQHSHWLVCNNAGEPVRRENVGDSKTNPAHWKDFDTVSRITESEAELWPYIVLTADSSFTVFDVDFKPKSEKETPDEYETRIERAQKSLAHLREIFPKRYESKSKSGKGFHIIVKGKFVGTGGKGKGEWRDVEIYTQRHGIALTGHISLGCDNPAEYPAETIQGMRDTIKASLPSVERNEDLPNLGRNGSVRPAHARRVLEELASMYDRPEYPIWRDISSAFFDGVGVETGIELLEEFWPEEKEGEYQKLAKSLQTYIPWGTLRSYGVNPDDPDEPLFLMPNLSEGEMESEKLSLIERAYALRFDPKATPPEEELCMVIGDIPIAARGNLTVIQGKSKVGKSAVVSAILGSAQRGRFPNAADTLHINWVGESTGAIIHLDTEQSPADWHGLVSRSVKRSGLPEVSDRLVSLPLVLFARSERMIILEETLKCELATKGSIDAVIIDGIADLCKSPNDENEALEVVSIMMLLSHKFKTPVFCILHENPSTEIGKTRGHLGSELNRKAFANLRIDKDSETSISTIYGLDMRKRDIPKEQGFCFGWDETEKMHVFKGRAAGLKAVRTKERALDKARSEWETIFESAEIGTNQECPELTPEQAAELLQDITGTKKTVTNGAMKKRMQRAESLGVLRRNGNGTWSLNPSGQLGQIRDI